jgi:UDP-N-acetylmuramate--alanine ligase
MGGVKYSTVVNLKKTMRAHLLGVAGSGMRAMARVLLQSGWTVSGSDISEFGSEPFWLGRLQFTLEYRLDRLPAGTELVVYSDAIGPEHRLRLEAQKAGIPTISYFEMIGQIMDGQFGIAVAGTHGKSTTTAIAAHILNEARAEPTVFCGAWPVGKTDGGHSGSGPIVLAEACEYRSHFHHLRPKIAVLTGIEPDHFDCFKSRTELERSFERFVGELPEDGMLIVSASDPVAIRIAEKAPCRVERFALADDLPRDGRAVQWVCRTVEDPLRGRKSQIYYKRSPLLEVFLPFHGRHNRLNALAAAALVWHNRVDPGTIGRALQTMPTLYRRQELVGNWRGAELIDDYAHHPTEIRMTLAAVRSRFAGRAVRVVFEPHQLSRMVALFDDFVRELAQADQVWVVDIFRAREAPPVPGELNAGDLARAIEARMGANVGWGSVQKIGASVAEELNPGDILLTLGAGKIRRIYDDSFKGFCAYRAA